MPFTSQLANTRARCQPGWSARPLRSPARASRPLVRQCLCYGLAPLVLVGIISAWLFCQPDLDMRAFPWRLEDTRTLQEVLIENQQKSAQLKAQQEYLAQRNEKRKAVAVQLIAEEISLPEAVRRYRALFEDDRYFPGCPNPWAINLCRGLLSCVYQVLEHQPERAKAVRARLEPQVSEFLARQVDPSRNGHDVEPESLWCGWPSPDFVNGPPRGSRTNAPPVKAPEEESP